MLLLEAAIWDAEISILDFYYLKLHWQTLQKGVYKFCSAV